MTLVIGPNFDPIGQFKVGAYMTSHITPASGASNPTIGAAVLAAAGLTVTGSGGAVGDKPCGLVMFFDQTGAPVTFKVTQMQMAISLGYASQGYAVPPILPSGRNLGYNPILEDAAGFPKDGVRPMVITAEALGLSLRGISPYDATAINPDGTLQSRPLIVTYEAASPAGLRTFIADCTQLFSNASRSLRNLGAAWNVPYNTMADAVNADLMNTINQPSRMVILNYLLSVDVEYDQLRKMALVVPVTAAFGGGRSHFASYPTLLAASPGVGLDSVVYPPQLGVLSVDTWVGVMLGQLQGQNIITIGASDNIDLDSGNGGPSVVQQGDHSLVVTASLSPLNVPFCMEAV